MNKERLVYIEINMEVSNEVKVKNEPIYDSQSISDTRKATLSKYHPNNITNNEQSIKNERQFIPISDSKRTREEISNEDQPNKRKRQSMKLKEERIDIEMQTSNSHIESTSEKVEIKAEKEEKFSAKEEFANKTSIAFLNEESTTSSDNDNLIRSTNQLTNSNDDTNNLR